MLHSSRYRFASKPALIAPVLLVACGSGSSTSSLGDGRSTASPASAGPAAPVALVEFNGDWSISQFGALVAGGQARISYQGARLSACRGELPGGGPAWTIVAYSSIDGGPPRGDEILGRSSDGHPLDGTLLLDLPAIGSHDLVLWFQVTNRYGCMSWDSSYGDNFHFRVEADQGNIVHFRPDFTESVEGRLAAGDGATIDYDLSRLPRCRQTYSGIPTWSVTAYYRFDGQAPRSMPVRRTYGGAELPAWIPFPSGARTLELWFMNTDRTGCTDWDSRFGANYQFALGAPPWLGNGRVVIARGPCGAGCATPPLEGGFNFDTWARTRADITRLHFEVYEQGVTDFDNPELARSLDVQLYSRVGSSGPFTASSISCDSRSGDNALYAIDLRSLDPLGGVRGGALTSTADCPTFPTSFSADGQYVQADFQYFVRANGVDLRPGAGGVFRGLYSNFRGLYAICE